MQAENLDLGQKLSLAQAEKLDLSQKLEAANNIIMGMANEMREYSFENVGLNQKLEDSDKKVEKLTDKLSKNSRNSSKPLALSKNRPLLLIKSRPANEQDSG